MHRSNIETVLASEYQPDIIQSLIDNYIRALGEYRKGNWQYFGNEVGQFIECSRRMKEYKHTGIIIPL